MPDYASAAPVQPIAQGLVTFPLGPGPGMPVQFQGRGFLLVARGALADGDYVLTLDPGLRGNAGAVPAGPLPPPDPDVRTVVTPVGGPLLSATVAIGIGYQTSPLFGVGATEVHVVTTNAAFVSHDPKLGFFIVVWRGQGIQAGVP
jgi:hypothetical protein